MNICVNLSNPFILIFVCGTVATFLINHFLEFIDFRARAKNGGNIPEVLQKIPAGQGLFPWEVPRKVPSEQASFPLQKLFQRKRFLSSLPLLLPRTSLPDPFPVSSLRIPPMTAAKALPMQQL